MAIAKLKCTCKHEFQDEKHGYGIRVHTPTMGKGGKNWRCTVCLNEKGGAAEDAVKSKK